MPTFRASLPLAVVVLSLAAPHAVTAEEEQAIGPPRRNTLALRAENDVVAGTDDNYSSGLSLTFSREGRGLLGGIWRWFGVDADRMVSSYELWQMIFTPADLKLAIPDPNDRPYAGLLFAALSTQSFHGNRFNGLKLIAGVVGPASLADRMQVSFHKAIGRPGPQGWGSQLKNEPILNMAYEHRRRFTMLDSQSGWGADVVPMAGAMFGNALIQAQAGAQFRFGYNVPQDFGTTLMRGLGNLPYPVSRHDTHHQFGVYLFAGGGANLVARNITLDGNTFRDGPRVAMNPVFATAETGVSLWTQAFQLTFTYVFSGREYKTQANPSRYGALTMAVHF